MRPKDASAKKGGRKTATIARTELQPALEAVVADHTAGSPVDEGIRWTNRSPRQIAEELQAQGLLICPETVRRLLREELELSVRQARRDEAARRYPHRDEQFEYLAELRDWYLRQRWPVLSIDTKKKELLGDFFRPGSAYTDVRLRVLVETTSALYEKGRKATRPFLERLPVEFDSFFPDLNYTLTSWGY